MTPRLDDIPGALQRDFTTPVRGERIARILGAIVFDTVGPTFVPSARVPADTAAECNYEMTLSVMPRAGSR